MKNVEYDVLAIEWCWRNIAPAPPNDTYGESNAWLGEPEDDVVLSDSDDGSDAEFDFLAHGADSL